MGKTVKQMLEEDEEEERVVAALHKIWPQVYVFVGWAVKRKINRDALLHTLTACLSKRIPPDECWAYCRGTLKIVNGNYNERQFQENAEEEKVDFKYMVKAFKQFLESPSFKRRN